MLRKLIVVAAIAAISGLAAFWFLTEPETVPASALGPHTPNLANGKEMFYAGGCASCHAVPKQEDKTKLGGGLALGSPFGTFYVPNISSDPKDGIGGWNEALTACVRSGQGDTGNVRADLDAAELASLLVEAWEGAALRGKVTRSRLPYDRFEAVTVPALLR